MYSVAFLVRRNVQDAEDGVQETFLKLHRGTAWQHMNHERAFLARAFGTVALDSVTEVEGARS
jgi:DNA-directed RNA polymerase specialized sigma24 family protein